MCKQVFIGIEIGGTKLQIHVGDQEGRIIKRFRILVGDKKEATLIQEAIRETLLQKIIPLGYPIVAVGIGFGGPVVIQEGVILKSYHVTGWSNFPIVQWLTQLIEVPVFLENDANLAALAEAQCGAGKTYNTVFYATIGSGIGAGLIQNGHIYHGRGIAEFELGHIRINREGPSFQNICSGWAVNKKIREASLQNPKSDLAQLIHSGDEPESSYLKAALDRNCPIANRVFSDLTDSVAFIFSHVVHLLNPEILIIGGGLSLMGNILAQKIEEKMPAYLMDAMIPSPVVRIACLKEDVVVKGAIQLAINKLNNK